MDNATQQHLIEQSVVAHSQENNEEQERKKAIQNFRAEMEERRGVFLGLGERLRRDCEAGKTRCLICREEENQGETVVTLPHC